MYNPFFSSMMLAFEAQKVVERRLVLLAWGGREGRGEAVSMVTEKFWASIETSGMLMMGSSPETIVARYREYVGANSTRLATS